LLVFTNSYTGSKASLILTFRLFVPAGRHMQVAHCLLKDRVRDWTWVILWMVWRVIPSL
jgi:hypothetical protein